MDGATPGCSERLVLLLFDGKESFRGERKCGEFPNSWELCEGRIDHPFGGHQHRQTGMW